MNLLVCTLTVEEWMEMIENTSRLRFVALITEFCDGGALDQYVKRYRVSRKRLLVMVRDVAAGLQHLHSHAIVHRDLVCFAVVD